jgi:hypothetical protein
MPFVSACLTRGSGGDQNAPHLIESTQLVGDCTALQLASCSLHDGELMPAPSSEFVDEYRLEMDEINLP